MANYGGYGYQYETSPKKLQPEYEKIVHLFYANP